MTKKTKKKKKRLTANELKALELVAKDPGKSNHAIGKDMVELGQVKDNSYLIHRVKRNTTMRDQIAILQEKGQLKFTRLIPKAAKKLKDYLDDDKTPLKAIDIAAKYGLGRQDDAPPRQPMIHVDTLNIVQNNQLRVLEERRDAIDITKSSSDNE